MKMLFWDCVRAHGPNPQTGGACTTGGSTWPPIGLAIRFDASRVGAPTSTAKPTAKPTTTRKRRTA